MEHFKNQAALTSFLTDKCLLKVNNNEKKVWMLLNRRKLGFGKLLRKAVLKSKDSEKLFWKFLQKQLYQSLFLIELLAVGLQVHWKRDFNRGILM